MQVAMGWTNSHLHQFICGESMYAVHKSMQEWLSRPFDPESFDVAKANHWLRKLRWPRVTERQLRKILMARDGYHE